MSLSRRVIETSDRAAVGELITMKDYVDVIVPRGGKGLIERISNEARIPVIKHLDGNCHVYIDDDADFDKALRILENSKTQRLGTCNTAESLLIARAVAASMLPPDPIPTNKPPMVAKRWAGNQAANRVSMPMRLPLMPMPIRKRAQ